MKYNTNEVVQINQYYQINKCICKKYMIEWLEKLSTT